jgi:hypothetical protein
LRTEEEEIESLCVLLLTHHTHHSFVDHDNDARTSNPFLAKLFGPDVLGRLPTSGQDRIWRTMLGLIGRGIAHMTFDRRPNIPRSVVYSTWFTTQPKAPTPTSSPSLLMNTISYVVAALPEPALCLPAANALRDLFDANRAVLAPHIGGTQDSFLILDESPEERAEADGALRDWDVGNEALVKSLYVVLACTSVTALG